MDLCIATFRAWSSWMILCVGARPPYACSRDTFNLHNDFVRHGGIYKYIYTCIMHISLYVSILSLSLPLCLSLSLSLSIYIYI